MNKIFNCSVLLCLFVFLCYGSVAQTNESRFLQEARNALKEGDCKRASDNYEMAKKLDDVTDVDVEKAIALCKPADKDCIYTCDYLDYYFYLGGVEMAYDIAEHAAKKSKFGEYSDWRLPTIKELQMVIDYHCKSVSNDNVIKDKKFWSSTPKTSDPLYVYTYKFDRPLYDSYCYKRSNSKKYSCVFVRNNKNKRK